ncbi:MAG: sigma-70 family RNA polymerase sigma factor [Clostridiales bacterium]|nr:sigma-70 family RNA polymerase sigma factor [Clostridia bacterium]NLD03805.1 sigma-70 family RNA polymerase sigma factor [Clostridiales bacterium]
MDNQTEAASLVESLYLRYADDVLRVSYFYLGDREKAEDVMQEVFLRVMDKQPVLREGSEKSWLLKVALNICRDQWRSSWAKRVILGSKRLDIIPADDELEDRTEKEALMQAVHSLPADVREVFLLFYYQRYTIEEIAKILDVQAGTVSSRLSRGRKKLKVLLEEGEAQNEA